MAVFKRGLSSPFLMRLNEEYDKGGWWKVLADDPDLFIGIREDYLNVYYKGNSLFKITYPGNDIIAETHYKYLLIPVKKNPYIKFTNGQMLAEKGSFDNYFLKEFSQKSLGQIRRATTPYAGLEKMGVHEILKGNNNIMDVEIALSKEGEREADGSQVLVEKNSEARKTAPRMDFSALIQSDGKLKLIFYEAKHFSYTLALRKKGDDKPKAVVQINEYHDLLEKMKDSIKKAYQTVFKNIVDLEGTGLLEKRKEIAKKALADDFQISTSPKLVIFGFDNDQKICSAWTPHLQKLEKFLGNDRVITCGSAGNIKIN